MGFQCGFIGLPNVGKSTLFDSMARLGIAAENYPFCTIEPNIGAVDVPDPRLHQLQSLVGSQRVIPASLQLTDIAGLVKGASRGEGLGNQFLSHVRQVHALVHVVRCFEGEHIVHVHDRVSPVEDVHIIETELCLSDLQLLEKARDRYRKLAKAPGKDGEKALPYAQAVETMVGHLESGRLLRELVMDEPMWAIAHEYRLITIKPMLYCANVHSEPNAYSEQLRVFAEERGADFMVISAKIEHELAELSEEERMDFLADLGWEAPGLHRLIQAGYRMLQLQTFFTVGPKEVHAWTIPMGTQAPKAAGVIHSDFEKGFIRAEVISYDDFLRVGGEAQAKSEGLMRVEGKDYVVQDGDIIHFRVQK